MGNETGQLGALAGVRILVVDDDVLNASLLADLLQSDGCIIEGPVGDLDSTTDLARTRDIAVALLDINLDDQVVYPAADVLMTRRIPFIFMTGSLRQILPPRFQGTPMVSKPFKYHHVREAIAGILGDHLAT